MLMRAIYEELMYTLPSRFPTIRASTLVLAPPGLDTARLTGLIAFDGQIVLCAHEVLDFQHGIIAEYRYEVSRSHVPWYETIPDEYCRVNYPDKDKLYWYDSWPHPNTPSLKPNHPHHKHVPPDIKHNRIPAPNLSFVEPNLPFLIAEIERDLLRLP